MSLPQYSARWVTDDQGDIGVRVVGSLYRLDVLRDLGGPPIGIAYEATCYANSSNTWSRLWVRPMLGVWLPARVPPNYTLIIPGRLPTDPIVARIVFNEQTMAEPPDSTLTMNAMHVHMFPDGPVANRGDFIAGSVTCSTKSK